MIGPDSVHEAIEKVQLIRERLNTIPSHQKSYADMRSRKHDFDVGDFKYLKISPIKRLKRFGKKGSLVPIILGHIIF